MALLRAYAGGGRGLGGGALLRSGCVGRWCFPGRSDSRLTLPLPSPVLPRPPQPLGAPVAAMTLRIQWCGCPAWPGGPRGHHPPAPRSTWGCTDSTQLPKQCAASSQPRSQPRLAFYISLKKTGGYTPFQNYLITLHSRSSSNSSWHLSLRDRVHATPHSPQQPEDCGNTPHSCPCTRPYAARAMSRS